MAKAAKCKSAGGLLFPNGAARRGGRCGILLAALEQPGYVGDMTQEELIARLTALHQELSQVERANPETLESLRVLTKDLERLTGHQQEVSVEDAEPVTSPLKDLLWKFEAEHPQLSASLGRVADALAAMGF